jgi:hypothetical protein
MCLAPLACKTSAPPGGGRYIPDESVKKWAPDQPKEYDRWVWAGIVSAQQDLARFGYGVHFTGEMDEQTIRALQGYQRHSGLAVTGNLDPSTREQLANDRDSIREPILPGSRRSLSASGGTLVAEGVWIKRGANLDRPEIDSAKVTHIECRHYPGDTMCREAENILASLHVDATGSAPILISNALTSEAPVTHWSQTRIEAEYRHPLGGLTVQYWFNLDKQTATKAWIRAQGIEYWDLQDGPEIYSQLLRKRDQARRRITLVPEYMFRPTR